MGSDDLATVASMFEAWNESNVDRMIDFWCEDGDWVWEDPPELPDAQITRGREAVEARLREVISVVGEMHIEVAELSEIGDEVFATLRLKIEGARSGVRLDAPSFALIRLENGRVRRYRWFNDREQALRAAQPDAP